MIRQMTAGDEFLPRVCAAIEDGLVNGFGKEADVAERLAMTPRTLHRKLQSQNTSFRKLRDDVLVKKAKRLLAQDGIPIAEVSFLLGYSEVSTFYRAFKRWTGTVPSLWREQDAER
jgi:AraC-like DNA-binding protein